MTSSITRQRSLQTWHAVDVQTQPSSMLNRALISLAGTTLVAVGAVGLFLPVIPGVVLVASGLAVLGRQYSWARRTLDHLTPTRFRRESEPPSSAEAA